jgi:eukaryotic-like serine/threonine-protein kinase
LSTIAKSWLVVIGKVDTSTHLAGYRVNRDLNDLRRRQRPAGVIIPAIMPLPPGTKLGPYEIVSPLGVGGMGEVYRAKDTRLDRTVAIKILPAHLSSDPVRKQRFEREAKTISILNHPHICVLFDVGSQDGIDYLVMECVEGETLAKRLEKGSLPLEQVLKYGMQIADALDQAHRSGVVHRDLKPGNVMLTPTGAKLLDFGLAKPTVPLASPVTLTAATRNSPMTEQGTIVGTFQYMSPEQVEGKELDGRSDIFSLGAVLYEMLAGKRAFEGKSQLSVISAILEKEPDPINALKPTTPPTLDHAIRRCLAKDPEERWQAARDLMLELKWIVEPGSQAGLAAPVLFRTKVRQRLAWSVAAALVMALAAVSFLHFREKPPAPAAPVRFQIPAPENTTLGPWLSMSPDGRKLAFVAGGRLWVHFLESGESRDLTAAENLPFWSPDSRFIGYASQGKLKKIEATGGPPQTVADLHGSWGAGAWNQDNVIVFGSASGLFRVPATGGVPVQITAVDPARREVLHYCPSFLPDGQHFVYIRASADGEKSAIYLGSVNAKPEQQSSKSLVASNWGPAYAPSADPSAGYLLFMREGTLMAQPFDNLRLELKGQATPVAEQVADSMGGSGYGAFSASANDVLVFWRGGAARHQQLTWYDRQGKVLGTTGEPDDYRDLALSPDGTRVALSKRSGQDRNIWLLDLSRNTSTRFTFGSAIDSNPVWSPDGSRMIFTSGNDLYEKSASGVKDAELLLKSSVVPYADSWSRDGRFLLYVVNDPKTKYDIWVLPLEGDKKPFPFLVTEFNEGAVRFSPDGHWVAYCSDESGHWEVYVRSFALNSAGTAVEAGGKWQISNGFGYGPRWRGDGRELYYRDRDGQVMAAEIATKPEFKPGKPEPLGFAVAVGIYSGLAWVASADGRRFLVAAPKSNRPEPYTVILNWQVSLKK